MTLADLIREKLDARRKGFVAVSVDVEELERWAQLAERPFAQDDLPDEIIVYLEPKR